MHATYCVVDNLGDDVGFYDTEDEARTRALHWNTQTPDLGPHHILRRTDDGWEEIPTTQQAPSFVYRVVDKNGEQRVDLAFLAPTEADNARVFYDEQAPWGGPFRVQRAQVHWEDVPE